MEYTNRLNRLSANKTTYQKERGSTAMETHTWHDKTFQVFRGQELAGPLGTYRAWPDLWYWDWTPLGQYVLATALGVSFATKAKAIADAKRLIERWKTSEG